ncbi:MAG: response regulator [Alcanivoracaceae bacterium]|jgi:twitching motility two-component system response regulator PilG|nr:response regulator [Alcanivoracaceae bacterium]
MALDSRQTTKSRSRIFHIGLEPREVLVIKSMFRIAPELNNRYVFGEPTEDDPVDLVFVNADDEAAMNGWQSLHRKRPDCVGIMVSADGEKRDESSKVIRKPLMFKKFVELLELITSDDAHQSVVGSDGRPMNVLVVDDSFPARQFMKFKLQEIARGVANLEIDFAENGEKALQMAEEKHYDTIFLDVIMPGMDGYELCRRLKKHDDCYIAMLTGQTTKVDKVRGDLAGCDKYLAKPPVDDEIRKVIVANQH